MKFEFLSFERNAKKVDICIDDHFLQLETLSLSSELQKKGP